MERRSFRPKLCRNCTVPQNFYTRKLGEISAFYTVYYSHIKKHFAHIINNGFPSSCRYMYCFSVTAFVPCRSLHYKCRYLEFFWSVFSCIRSEYGNLQSKSPYLVPMWENADQKNSEYG